MVKKDRLYDYALEPVPLDKRRSFYSTVTVWGGWVISITAFLVGGLVGGGLPLNKAIPAILIGNTVLFAIASLLGTIGMKTGLSSTLISRAIFGKYGAIVLSIVIGIIGMGFVGVFAGAVGEFFQSFDLPFALGAIVFMIAVTTTAILGFRGLSYLSWIAVPLLLILAVIGLFKVGGTIPGGLSAVSSMTPKGTMPFTTGVTLAIATWITGTFLCPDIGRYAKNKWHVIAGAFVGWIVGAAFLETVSAMMALGVGSGNIVEVMIGIGLTVPAVIIFFGAMWTTADNNLYSFSLAFTNICGILNARQLKKHIWVIIGSITALILALAGIYGEFKTFLLQLATFVPPIAGVYLGEYYMLMKYKLEGEELNKQIFEAKSININAFIAWGIGSAVAYFYKGGIPAIQGLLVAMIVYFVLEKTVQTRN
ncbi:MAG: hypothetical protein DRP55_07455 [Spirochaetes bacterium]|nr:MAG: hypothetical protein DRP55_07455 [Spirochaetota bacterium]